MIRRALEAMLNSSVAALESELAILRTLVLGVLDGLEQHIGKSKSGVLSGTDV